MDLLTKTGPISGAVWAREVERLQADAADFTSLKAVRNKAHLLVTASLLPNAEERVREQEEEEWGRVVKVVPLDHVREDRTQDRRLLMSILIFTRSKQCAHSDMSNQEKRTCRQQKPPEPLMVWAMFSLWAALILTSFQTAALPPLVFYKPAV